VHYEKGDRGCFLKYGMEQRIAIPTRQFFAKVNQSFSQFSSLDDY
jgi:uncharacterized radical SAM superfamily protein